MLAAHCRRTPADRLARAHYWRAKKLNGNRPNGFWPGVWWERLIAETHSTCQYCGTYTDHPSPDHAQALSRGGTNEWENIRLACPSCQRAKGVRTEADYRATLAQKEPTPMSLTLTTCIRAVNDRMVALCDAIARHADTATLEEHLRHLEASIDQLEDRIQWEKALRVAEHMEVA